MVTKIACLAPLHFPAGSLPGESERFLVNFARGVVEASYGKYSVELVFFGDFSHRQSLSPGVSLRLLPAATAHPTSHTVLSWELPDVILGADLVHLHHPFTRSGEMCLLLASLHRKPICVSQHGVVDSKLGFALESLRLANHIFCHSRHEATLLNAPDVVTMIPPGIDARFFSPAVEPSPRDCVLFVGGLEPESGLETLIAALPETTLLTVLARPEDEPHLPRLREAAGAKRVEFVLDWGREECVNARAVTPAVQTQKLSGMRLLRALYRRALVCVQPTASLEVRSASALLPQQLGLPLLEAMACGTPVISSRIGALPELVPEGQAGFVFDSLAELGHQLQQLFANSGLVEKLGRRARQIAAREYDFRVIGARLLEIYREALSQAHGVAA